VTLIRGRSSKGHKLAQRAAARKKLLVQALEGCDGLHAAAPGSTDDFHRCANILVDDG